jgi:hypothetical protein
MQSDCIGRIVPLQAPTTSPVHNFLGIVSYAPFHHLTTDNDIGTAAVAEPGQVEGTPELRLRPFPPLTTNNEIGATAVAEPNQVEGTPELWPCPFPPLTTNNNIGTAAIAEPDQVEGNPALLGTC